MKNLILILMLIGLLLDFYAVFNLFRFKIGFNIIGNRTYVSRTSRVKLNKYLVIGGVGITITSIASILKIFVG
ncbi:hypothetical protein [Clostridium intestinale]|uniref:hypothetical protein n=1 Tax=Clostridium intestinale TaxID=36845 RepID=UPI002DD67713|nr:hypothetical protein [Clostridium intestinale]WRY51085.1 hypothetical protein P8F83_20950 [Clostridium intestinale]